MLAPRRLSRLRRAVFWSAEALATVLGGRRFYRWRYLTLKRLAIRRLTLDVEDLPAALEGLRIVHLSDPHGGRFMARGDLADVVKATRSLEPDIVCWTGDYIVRHPSELGPILPELRQLTGRLGTYAVYGNHDYKQRRESEMAAALDESGWTFLRNDSRRLEIGDASVVVAGVEDAEESRGVDVARAARDFDGSDLRISLTHAPQVAPYFAEVGAHLVLAGHSHGTQVDLPFLRDLGPSHPGLEIKLGETTLIVHRGLGVIGGPIRFGVPAEIVLLTMRRAGRSEG